MGKRTPLLIAVGAALLAVLVLRPWEAGGVSEPRSTGTDAETSTTEAAGNVAGGRATGNDVAGEDVAGEASGRRPLDVAGTEAAFEPFDLRGRVVDRAGQGVGGCELRLGEGERGVDVRASADGTFELASRWPPRSRVRVAASAPLVLVDGDRLLRSVTVERQSPLDLVAVWPGTLTGTVQDRDGRPIGGAVVVGFGPGLTHRVLTWSDAAGRFAARAVAVLDRPLSVQAWTRDLAVSQVVELELHAGGHRALALVLQRPASLTGRVVGPGDAPVAGALVRLGTGDRSHVPGGPAAPVLMEATSGRPEGAWDGVVAEDPLAIRSGADGSFAFAAVPPGAYQLRWDQDVGRRLEPVYDDGPPTLRLTEGEQRGGLVLRMREPGDAAWRIQGRVLDPDGGPVARVSVYAVPAGTARTPDDVKHMTGMVFTDAEGKFVLQSTEGGVLRVAVASVSSPEQLAWRKPPAVEVAVGSRDVELRFSVGRGATLRGRFVAPPGEALPAAIDAALIGASVLRLRAGPDGRFEVSDVPPGKFRLEWRQDPLMLAPRQVEVNEGLDQDLGDLALVALGRIEGRVVDGAGAPLAGVAVVLDRGWFPGLERKPELAAMHTGTDGRFEVRGLRPDGTVFVLAKAGWAPIQKVLRTAAEGRMRDWRMVPVTRLHLRGLPKDEEYAVWPATPGRPRQGAVRLVPTGPAATYGDIADEAFLRGRVVGYALEAGTASFEAVPVGAWRAELLGLRDGRQVVLATRDLRLEAGAERRFEWD
ncbi:MAG: carboxypeptidase-like regulatory domain-containing protein [Planctomycetota bacterium]